MGLYSSEYEDYHHFSMENGYVSEGSDQASEAVEAWESSPGPLEAV